MNTCQKPDCYFCYEMNRSKTDKNLIMPKIKPQQLSAYSYENRYSPRNYTSQKRIYLDTETGIEYFAEQAMRLVRLCSKNHFIGMTNGTSPTRNWTPFVKII
jgi:hypothetical protein